MKRLLINSRVSSSASFRIPIISKDKSIDSIGEGAHARAFKVHETIELFARFPC